LAMFELQARFISFIRFFEGCPVVQDPKK